MKYTNSFHPKAFKNTPKLAFLVWKNTSGDPGWVHSKHVQQFGEFRRLNWPINKQNLEKVCINRTIQFGIV
jgi:hypothetical protein